MDLDKLDKDLEQLTVLQQAAHFSDRVADLEADFPHLMLPMLHASKSVLALDVLCSGRFTIAHLEKWREGIKGIVYAKNALQEQVASLEMDCKDMRSDGQKDAYRYLRQAGIRVSDEKVQAHLRQNEDYRKRDRQLSVLRAILTSVLDQVEQYKLIKDVLVQESTLTKRMMA